MKFLRARLFLGYLGSLLILTGFFYIFVHILSLPNSTEYLFLLLTVLTVAGFFVVYRINDLLNRLQASLAREQQFIADVAHELKTPMATLRASLELASQKQKNPVITEAIFEIDRLSSTLKDVLELAWSATPLSQQPGKFNLTALMDELAEIATKMAVAKNIAVSQTIDKGIDVVGFREKLARAILNIIENAIKYSPDNGQVDISLEKVADTALIVIKDTGIGIAKQELPHVFNRFYRGAKTSKIFGSGLGLAISKSIVQLHGGTIRVKSQTGHGTTFAVVIPAI